MPASNAETPSPTSWSAEARSTEDSPESIRAHVALVRGLLEEIRRRPAVDAFVLGLLAQIEDEVERLARLPPSDRAAASRFPA